MLTGQIGDGIDPDIGDMFYDGVAAFINHKPTSPSSVVDQKH